MFTKEPQKGELFNSAKVTGSVYAYFTELQVDPNGTASQNPQPSTKQTDNEITVAPHAGKSL